MVEGCAEDGGYLVFTCENGATYRGMPRIVSKGNLKWDNFKETLKSVATLKIIILFVSLYG